MKIPIATNSSPFAARVAAWVIVVGVIVDQAERIGGILGNSLWMAWVLVSQENHVGRWAVEWVRGLIP
tara:strand:+ start:306 stop:509 length:204 start_codon:yes stop_codon:yes gene_type:complete